MKTKHKQVLIKWGANAAQVDKKLAPLILELWKHDIETVMSCQENQPGICWINFPTASDAEAFLNLVAIYPDKDSKIPFWETLYSRMRGGDGWHWNYSLSPEDMNVRGEIVGGEEYVETSVGPPDFVFSVSVRFPASDLPEILSNIRSKL